MTIRVGLNGFGQTGRDFMRAVLTEGVEHAEDIEIVAVNDPAQAGTLALLLCYDAARDKLAADVQAGAQELTVAGRTIMTWTERGPAAPPWAELGVDVVVVESTAAWAADSRWARAHVAAGAKKVVHTAPVGGEDITIVFGVNDEHYDPQRHSIISNASSATHCLATMAKVLHEAFGIELGMTTTIQAETPDQGRRDGLHRDLRRVCARVAGAMPSSPGTAETIGSVLPELDGRLDGCTLLVPAIAGSVVDLNIQAIRRTTAAEVNDAFQDAVAGQLARVLSYSKDPIVSNDIVHESASCVVDAGLTRVLGNNVKVVGRYDHQWASVNRLVDVVRLVGQ